MGRFTGRLRIAAGLAALGVLAAAAPFIDHGPGHATAVLALAGGLFTVALAVVVRD
jgi:hypothetical protein